MTATIDATRDRRTPVKVPVNGVIHSELIVEALTRYSDREVFVSWSAG